MPSDLIRLLVNTRHKELTTRADQNGSLGTYSMSDRVGLSGPLDKKKKRVSQMILHVHADTDKLSAMKPLLSTTNDITA